MTNEWLLTEAVIIPMDPNTILIQSVELLTTYLLQSTLFLSASWLALAMFSWFRGPHRRPSPSAIELSWKLAAALPLLTAPMSVVTDWSPSTIKLSFASKQEIREDRTGVSAEPIGEQTEEPANPVEQLSVEANNEAVDLSNDHFLQPLPQSSPAQFESEFSLESLSRVQRTLGETGNSRTESAIDGDSMTPSSNSLMAKVPPIADIAWCGIAIFTWILLCTGRMICKGISLCLWLRHCRPIDSSLRSELNRLIPQGPNIRLLRATPHQNPFRGILASIRPNRNEMQPLSIRQQRVQPFACGVLSWTIVLPEGIENRLSLDELRALLMHEVAHLIRRDPLWQWFGQLLCTCLAFQPLNFLARHRWQQAAELLCDDWAIDQNIAPTRLASCLTQIAEWRLEQTSACRQVGLPAMANTDSLTRRIEWLLRTGRNNESKHPVIRTVSTVVIFAVGILAGMCGPRLVLTESAHAETESTVYETDVTDGEKLNQEFTAAWKELSHLQSQLRELASPEIDALSNDLVIRAAKIKSELEQ